MLTDFQYFFSVICSCKSLAKVVVDDSTARVAALSRTVLDLRDSSRLEDKNRGLGLDLGLEEV